MDRSPRQQPDLHGLDPGRASRTTAARGSGGGTRVERLPGAPGRFGTPGGGGGRGGRGRPAERSARPRRAGGRTLPDHGEWALGRPQRRPGGGDRWTRLRRVTASGLRTTPAPTCRDRPVDRSAQQRRREGTDGRAPRQGWRWRGLRRVRGPRRFQGPKRHAGPPHGRCGPHGRGGRPAKCGWRRCVRGAHRR